MTDLKMSEPSGNCPVQAYGTIDGWLLYFRARSDWMLYAWKPGHWDTTLDPEEACCPILDTWPKHDVLIDGVAEDARLWHDGQHTNIISEGFPTGSTEHYPGWWEPEYAKKVIAWAVERLPRGE